MEGLVREMNHDEKLVSEYKFGKMKKKELMHQL